MNDLRITNLSMKAIAAFILADVGKGLAISALHANAGTRAFDAAIPVLLVVGDAVALLVALYQSSGQMRVSSEDVSLIVTTRV